MRALILYVNISRAWFKNFGFIVRAPTHRKNKTQQTHSQSVQSTNTASRSTSIWRRWWYDKDLPDRHEDGAAEGERDVVANTAPKHRVARHADCEVPEPRVRTGVFFNHATAR